MTKINCVEQYLRDISKIDLVSTEKEIELAKKVKQGDEKSMNELIKSNLRFVVSVAKQYQYQGLKLEDLINEGNLGLIKAAKRFDETRGFKFISFAVWWIRQSILEAISTHSRMVRLPMNKINELNLIQKTYNELEQKYCRIPTVMEVAKKLKMECEDVADILGIIRPEISFDAPMYDGEDTNLLDVTQNDKAQSPDYNLMTESLDYHIQKILSCLDEREKYIVESYFGLNSKTRLTLEEIGDNLGLTKERIRQLKEKAVRNLRRNVTSEKLKEFFK